MNVEYDEERDSVPAFQRKFAQPGDARSSVRSGTTAGDTNFLDAASRADTTRTTGETVFHDARSYFSSGDVVDINIDDPPDDADAAEDDGGFGNRMGGPPPRMLLSEATLERPPPPEPTAEQPHPRIQLSERPPSTGAPRPRVSVPVPRSTVSSFSESEECTFPPVRASAGYRPTPASYRPVSEAVPASYRPVLETVPASYRPVSEAVPASYRPVSEAVPASYRPVSEAVPASYRPVSEAVPASYRPVSEALPASRRPVQVEVPSASKRPSSEMTPADHRPMEEFVVPVSFEPAHAEIPVQEEMVAPTSFRPIQMPPPENATWKRASRPSDLELPPTSYAVMETDISAATTPAGPQEELPIPRVLAPSPPPQLRYQPAEVSPRWSTNGGRAVIPPSQKKRASLRRSRGSYGDEFSSSEELHSPGSGHPPQGFTNPGFEAEGRFSTISLGDSTDTNIRPPKKYSKRQTLLVGAIALCIVFFIALIIALAVGLTVNRSP